MTGGARCYVIDANVVLRYLLGEPQEQAAAAGEVMAAIEAGAMLGYLSPVALAEIVWVLSSFYELPAADIAAALEPIVKNENVLVPGKEIYVKALELFADGVKHFGDACACAAAMVECDGRLVSFDRELSRVDGITRTEKPEK